MNRCNGANLEPDATEARFSSKLDDRQYIGRLCNVHNCIVPTIQLAALTELFGTPVKRVDSAHQDRRPSRPPRHCRSNCHAPWPRMNVSMGLYRFPSVLHQASCDEKGKMNGINASYR